MAVPSDTEITLKNWRVGSIIAERLCADLLSTEGFVDIDPQSPLGGPDGKKDIICNRNGISFIAACYFPPTQNDYNNIEAKFIEDLSGIKRNGVEGFIFFTNQNISPFQRKKLVELAAQNGSDVTEIYHVERIRSILDSPSGYGLRLQYLDIELTKEEQISFIDQVNRNFNQQIAELSAKFDKFSARTIAEFADLRESPSSLGTPLPELPHFATAALTLEQLCWLHRIVTDNSRLSPEQRGSIRCVQVWVAHNSRSWDSGEQATQEAIHIIGPPPKEIYDKIESLINWWRSNYNRILIGNNEMRIEAIATFHHQLLLIHPFLDGNGRLARAVLQQQIIELLNRHLSANFTDEREEYIDCLMSADNGDLSPLIALIQSNLE